MPKLEFESLLGASADFTAAFLGKFEGDMSYMGPALALVAPAYGLATLKKASAIDVVPNPYFVANGHDDDDGNVITREYLWSRKLKGIAGGVAGAAGAGIAIPAGGIDGIGAARHANAIGSSLIHIGKLERIARRHKASQKIAAWCLLIQRMKLFAKGGIRATQLVGAVVPAASFPTGVIAAVGSAAVAQTVGGVCLACAAEIHWRAFQETKIAGLHRKSAGPVGPATEIMYELFRRRGMTRVLGAYDVARLISEPAGWMAVGDKIMLI